MFNISSYIKSVSSIKFNLTIKSMLRSRLSQKQKYYQMLVNQASLKLESKLKMLWVIWENFPNKNFLTLSISNSKNSKELHKIWKKECKISDFLTDFIKNIKQHFKPFFKNYYLAGLHNKNFQHYFGFFFYL